MEKGQYREHLSRIVRYLRTKVQKGRSWGSHVMFISGRKDSPDPLFLLLTVGRTRSPFRLYDQVSNLGDGLY